MWEKNFTTLRDVLHRVALLNATITVMSFGIRKNIKKLKSRMPFEII